MRPPCRRREHRWRVAAQDALPAEPLQKQQENWRQALNPSAQALRPSLHGEGLFSFRTNFPAETRPDVPIFCVRSRTRQDRFVRHGIEV